MELLLSHGADMDKSNSRHGVPLHVAIGGLDLDLSLLLLEKGANVNVFGGNFETPLYTAVSNWDEQTVKFLIGKGGNTKAIGGKWGNVLNAVIAQGLDFPDTWERVKLLLEHGASVQDEDQQGRAAVHMAGQGGNLKTLENLLALDSDGLSRRDKQGRTVLHFAAANGRRDMVSDILGLQDVQASGWQDGDGWTPLHWASRQDNKEMIRLLLEKGFDVLAKSSNNWLPIHVAIFHDNKKVADLLKTKQNDLDELSKSNPGPAESELRDKKDEDVETNKKSDTEESDSAGDFEDEGPPGPLFSPEGLPLRSASIRISFSTTYICDGCYCVSSLSLHGLWMY